MTTFVNALRSKWVNIPPGDFEAIVDRFLDRPLDDEFCPVHYVLEEFEYRAQDQQQFQALPIPPLVRDAKTLRQIADAFAYDPEALVKVNGWIWVGPDAALDHELDKGDPVNIPDPEFAPVLAARFAAEALVAEGLAIERRSMIIQRLVRMALPNPTALDTVLGRLMLSTLERPAELPSMLSMLALGGTPAAAVPAELYGRLSPL